MKNCLIVFGMHRSGTSAFTGILDLLGINLGTKMLETQYDNPKGFFENKYVVQANDCIMESLQSSWDDILGLPADWTSYFDDSQLHSDIRQFLQTDILEGQLSALKDPRLCRLLPLWLPHFKAEGVAVHVALVIRNPLEIAESLQNRNGFSREKSLLLWMQYMLEAELNSRHLPRGYVQFDELLQNPEVAVARAFEGAELEVPTFSGERQQELAEFVDSNMRHHEIAPEDLDRLCPAPVAELYRLLCDIAERGKANEKDIRAIDTLRNEFESDLALYYNPDVQALKRQDLERTSPGWYAAALSDVREQFERDKINREYRYVANTQHLIREREAALSERDDVIVQKDAIVAEKDKFIANQDLIIAERDTGIRDRDEIIAHREGIIAEREAVIEHREGVIAQRDEIIAEKNESIAQEQKRYRQLLERAESLQKQVDHFTQTLPYKFQKLYEDSLDRVAPRGGGVRRSLQGMKSRLTGAEPAAPADQAPGPAAGPEIAPELVPPEVVEPAQVPAPQPQPEPQPEPEPEPQAEPETQEETPSREEGEVPAEAEAQAAHEAATEAGQAPGQDASPELELPADPEPGPAEELAPTATVEAIGDTQQPATDEPPAAVDVDLPLVSIIIPVHNNWAFTEKCLDSVRRYTPQPHELIVVDNNSSDETPEKLAQIEGLVVISNDENEVFVNACNQAAEIATGDYILLLNNDTEVTAGWLPAMLAPFDSPRTGVVGAKLVYPDGSLQEAGNVIWADGSGYNYGHGDNPDWPRYNYRRAVDYCSGAALLIPAPLWREIGGLDTRYAPAYYEDTDLCFTVRSLNLDVIYQPEAVVVHYGGASAGKDTSSGYKRFQDVNREKFVAKWRETLDRDHASDSSDSFHARERMGDKQILIIDHHVPTFDRDSGSQRMLSMLKILQDMGYKVTFWPDSMTFDERYTCVLQSMGVETWYGDTRFEDFIREAGPRLDAVLMSRPATAQKYLQLVKQFSDAQTIFDTVDLHFVREQRRLELEVQQWKNLEFYLANETDATFVVSPVEKEILAGESFADKVSVISNIHSLEPCEKGFDERSGLLFIGGFAHPPNEEGILWFLEYILPLVRKRIPDIHLTIVGNNPTDAVLAQASEYVTVTGYVEDVTDIFNDSRVFISPLLHGAGVKGKIGQSFSFGLPVVTTSVGAEGMYLVDGQNALISDSEAEFADKIVELYNEKFLWQKLSTNGRHVITEQFSPDTIRTALEKALQPPGTQGDTEARKVLLHCHLFKNAGTTLDWSLHRNFGDDFIDHRDDMSMRRGAGYLGPYLDHHPHIRALSSHHVQFPLPVIDGVAIMLMVSFRDPIERARSVYDFERRQDATTPGAVKAKELSFADYVRWRLRPGVAPTIRNFHCAWTTSIRDRLIGEPEYRKALSQLIATPGIVIVERYDESMVLLEHDLAEHFPGLDLAYVRQNTSPLRLGNLRERVKAIYEDLGEELTLEFREANHWDVELYHDARAIFEERLGKIGDLEDRLEKFRARCRLLLEREAAQDG